MKRVAIMGAGPVGATVARALAEHEVSCEVCLVDTAAAVAAGKALDITQSGPIEGSDTRVVGSGDLSAATGADLIVVADRHDADGEWTGEIALDLLRRLQPLVGSAPFVFAGALQRGVIGMAERELRIAPHRLLGSAPDALASSARALVAAATGASPADVGVPLLGSPGRWVVAWSEARIGASGAAAILAPFLIARLEGQIAASWPPGPYALGSAAARVVRAAFAGSLRQFTVFTPVQPASDVRRSTIAVPVTVDATGIRATHQPALSGRERVLLDGALAAG